MACCCGPAFVFCFVHLIAFGTGTKMTFSCFSDRASSYVPGK